MCRARIKNLHRCPPKNRLPLRTTPNTVSTQNCTATSNTVVHIVILNITNTAQPRAYVQPCGVVGVEVVPQKFLTHSLSVMLSLSRHSNVLGTLMYKK